MEKPCRAVMTLSFLTAFAVGIAACSAQEVENPMIDYEGFEKVVSETKSHRAKRLMREDQFINMMKDKNVILLDARSREFYAMRHVKGAVNLPFTDFTAESLAKVIPNKDTKILIYCNNNFDGDQRAFQGKAARASLNLSTYTNLVVYGYTNVYELAPYLSINTTRIPFEGTEVTPSAANPS